MISYQTDPPGQEPSVLDSSITNSIQDPTVLTDHLKDEKGLVEVAKGTIAYKSMKIKTAEVTNTHEAKHNETVIDQIQHIAEATAEKVEDMMEAGMDYLNATGLFLLKLGYETTKGITTVDDDS
uniref:Uncharacterized protein n=1 Tax=Acrobeloides nanus TaxID=290746 RepID=A0A914CIY3_9BILA